MSSLTWAVLLRQYKCAVMQMYLGIPNQLSKTSVMTMEAEYAGNSILKQATTTHTMEWPPSRLNQPQISELLPPNTWVQYLLFTPAPMCL